MAYQLVSLYDHTNFFNQFTFFTASDPTHGYVQYVDANTAQASGLAQMVNTNQIYLGVDNVTILNYPNGSIVTDSDDSASIAKAGRKSVRLESRQTFDQGLLIADFAHIPNSICGTWPAYWIYDYGEDPYGEVDIIEGVNDQVGDDISLHTSARCNLTADPQSETGTNVRTDCSLATNYIDGCGVSGPSNTYGDPFNAQGGGVWALWLDKDDLAVWMFPRTAIPDDIIKGQELTPKNWGKPLLHFKSHLGCRVSEQWKNQTIIFNIDFCGENASGSNWNESASSSAPQSCADSTKYSSCEAYVAANPRVFSNSYFLINSVKLYQSRIPLAAHENSSNGAVGARGSPGYIALWLMLAWSLVAHWVFHLS
ncbi:conserved hypothetical protein [Talaromyces stipitatus ATCC 10500]|uniref:GH16 domain-containing protein n=1 Tax=Talaromyces stipitatus (strain ATCC 10500 / CBS 375.48 / QM 6759 / NRRL 1006) TaxID=441959 RepID=B8M3P6_TALSN|nr:uncharacterized protein TSTA_096670 [Talaromyces stipitatus ATCC 10500]EED22418.1 conserved hypothetical protein [Talaromyces stipitatus ATCC 10500]